MTGEFVAVLVTAPNEDEAASIAKAVVGERLAACCNIIPKVRSIYTWEDKVCDEPEVLCVFKTRKSLFGELRNRVVELHSYDVPEVVAMDISVGSPAYLKWVGEVTG